MLTVSSIYTAATDPIMKIIYITRTDITSNAAQARQVESMATAFNKQLGSDFLLISAGRNGFLFPFRWRRINASLHPYLRYFKSCLAAVRCMVAHKNQATFFTRDIAVALVIAMLGGTAVYEAHKEPKSLFASVAVRMLSKSKRFKLVMISKALARYYAARFGVSQARILVAHDGVFPERYHPVDIVTKNTIRAEKGLPQDKMIVLHTGSLYKGGAELFKYVAEVNPEMIEVIQVGGSSKEIDFWKAYYRKIGCGNVRFIAHQPTDAVRQFQVCADVLLFVATLNSPIYWCTSPLKVFEYMATGVPILASNLGSINEILNNDNAFMYDPARPESIKAAIDSIIKNPDEAGRRAGAALHDVRSRYSWHERTNRIIRFTL